MKKIISILIPFLPILSIYKSPLPKVDLGTFIVCFLFVTILFNNKKNNKKTYCITRKSPINLLLLYCIYIIVSFFVIIIVGNQNVSTEIIIFRIVKMVLFVIFTNTCINNNLIDYDYSFNIMKKITILSCIMIIIQYILYYVFSINIYGVVMSLILQGNYEYIDYETIKNQYLYRPSAFFLEPSSMTSYFSCFLCILLNREKNSKGVILAIFATICMILTTSGQAFLYSFIIWVMFIYSCLKVHLTKKKMLLFLLAILIVPIIIYKSYNINIIYKSIQRIIDGSASGGNAILSRTSTISYFLALPIVAKVFGMGYGNPIPNVYFNSAVYTLYCTGIVGLIIIIMFFVKAYKKYNNKYLTIYWLISSFLSTTFIAINIGFIYPFVVDVSYSKKELSNK